MVGEIYFQVSVVMGVPIARWFPWWFQLLGSYVSTTGRSSNTKQVSGVERLLVLGRYKLILMFFAGVTMDVTGV